MLFNSLLFIIFFLPFTFMGYLLVTRLTDNPIYHLSFLTLASLVFYGHWDKHFIPIILASVAVNFLFGLVIGDLALEMKMRKSIFIFAILCNVAMLVYFKYINFGIDIYNSISHHDIQTLSIVLPLGISFFTFTQIAYLADILSGHPREQSFQKYILFVTYFPHLIAGPILHHKEMMPQFSIAPDKRISLDKIAIGLTIFAIGLFKKTILADGFAEIANPVFDAVAHDTLTMRDAWGGALAYALQIYFDFSAYSDMAIGISLLFGITLPFNFDMPYKSRNIIEFWRRWHITLSRFLRDYVYIPLGGNKAGKKRRYTNLMVTMLVGGLWHGAGWTYLIWGGLHGFYLMANHAWSSMLRLSQRLTKFSTTFGYSLLSLLLTQFCVVIAWVYFRSDKAHFANRMIKAMFHLRHTHFKSVNDHVTSLNFIAILVFYLVCFTFPNINMMFKPWKVGLQTYENSAAWNMVNIKWSPKVGWAILTAALLLLSLLMIFISDTGAQFLYFQF